MATILVAEDREAARRYLALLLQHAGHIVIEAADGLDAIARISKSAPDLVIADIFMPTMDGFEFIRQLREHPETTATPVIFYTAAYDEPETRALAENCTAATILPKPSEPEVLLQTVAKVLGEITRRQLPLGTEFQDAHLELITTKLHRKIDELEQTVTAMKVAEAELREGRERLRIALGAAEIGTWDYFPLTGERRWDARCKAAFGLPVDTPVDYEVFLRVLHPDDRELVTKAKEAALDPAGDGHFDLEYRTIGLEDGVERIVHSQGQAVFELVQGRRTATCFIGIVQDITARKQNEEGLRRANENLKQFAYAAAHDLQEPLRNVSNSLSLLQRLWPSPQESEAAQLVRDSSENAVRMLEMVRGLLEFSRVETNEPASEWTDAEEILNQVLKNLELSITETGARIRSGHLPMVRMAATHLTQLLQNVIGNSLKYRKAEQTPEIEVSAARHGSEWIFTVSDNGIGFDPAYAERVFGLFKRLHGKHEYPGTGIGLALCSRVVLAYGGRMWAESQLGAGATFHFTVPAVAPKREERRPDRPTRVLLVEDNALDAKLVSMALREQKNWATETVSVGDGEAAVLYLTQPDSLQKRSRPDLVLLDINLPKLDGTEVLRTIRTTRYLLELPVFVISSSPQDVIKERVLAARVSANQYLTKPLDVDGFLALGDTLRRLYHESVAGYK